MRRGKLISRGHHQLSLAHSVLARQPLVARLTKHQRLAQELGLPAMPARVAEASGRASTPPTRNLNRQAQGYEPPHGIMFRPALAIQAEDEYAIATTPEQPSHLPAQQAAPTRQPLEHPSAELYIAAPMHEFSAPEMLREPEIAPIPEEPEHVFVQPGTHVSMETSTDLQSQERDREPIEAYTQPELPATGQVEREDKKVSQSATSDEPAAPVIQSPEPVSLATPSEPKVADAPVQPAVESAKLPIEIIKPRRPRRSIEELSAQSMRDLAAPSQSAQSTKDAQRSQQSVQGTKAQQQPQTNAASQSAATPADELFAPTNTDRSPQAWLARLMGKSLPTPEPTPPTEPNATDIRRGEGGGVGQGWPLWSPAVTTPQMQPTEGEDVGDQPEVQPSYSAGDAGDHKGPPHPAQPPSPLRASMKQDDTQGNETATSPNATNIRRGEGGGVGQGGPLWSPAATTSEMQPTEDSPLWSPAEIIAEMQPSKGVDAGDHKGHPHVTPPPSPLRASMKPPYIGEIQASDVSSARPVPTPVSLHTRRFLQPLVGIDPASVRVHRDVEATRLTDAYQADAVTVGNDVEVAAGYTDDTPETLGLLAHEFTHVARQRDPNFIPPIVGSASPVTGSGQQPAAGQHSIFSPPIAPIASEPYSTIGEEALALQVERQVRRTAQEQQRQSGQLGPQTRSVSASSARGPIAAASSTPHRATNDPWGGLPAPWEPLPAWMASPPDATPAATNAAAVTPASRAVQPLPTMHGTDRGFVGAVHPGNGQVPLAGTGSAGAGFASAGVQRAGDERSLGVEAPPPLSSAHLSPAPEPDLDDLARQVYSRLKRRLEVERQRFS